MAVGAHDSAGRDGARLWLARWVFTPLAGVLLRDWVWLLRRFGRSIPPQYWGRVAFTTAMSAGASALAGRERRRSAPRLAALEVRAPVFVLGHHRSGTTHLWNLLATDARFASPTVLQAVFPHTFLTCERAMLGWARRFTPTRRPQDNVALSPDAPIEEERAICADCFLSMQMFRHFPRAADEFKPYLTMRDATDAERQRWRESLDRFARKLLLRHGAGRTLLFKAPDHTGKIRLILSLYPDARFVHIRRDPHEVFASTRQMELATQPLYAYQPLDESRLDGFILWRYRAMYEAYFEDAPVVPAGRLAEVAFEDLQARPREEVERVYAALGLGEPDRDALRAYVESIAGYRQNRRPEPTPATRAMVADAWRRNFRAWGYAP